MVKLCFIVNSYNNPSELLMHLACLKLQTTNEHFTVDIAIADNSDNEKAMANIVSVCKLFDGVQYFKTKNDGCYESATVVSKKVDADYLCFSSSDNYYMPMFSLLMLEVAVKNNSDLVYCNCVYDPRLHGRTIYSVLDTFPEQRWIDKGCFIIRKTKFKGFPAHKDDWRDGALVEQFVKKGYKLDKAKGILMVHN